jgi:hypothetical protein
MDPTAMFALRPISGVLLGLVSAPIALRLDVPTHEWLGILFLLLFGLNTLVNVIEGLFFTTWLGQAAAGTLVAVVPGNLATAWLLAVLFTPESVRRTLFSAAHDLFRQRQSLAWLARFVAAGLAFVPIYYAFGRLIYPLVQSYYEDPAVALGLRVPSLEEILMLQVGRGLLFVCARAAVGRAVARAVVAARVVDRADDRGSCGMGAPADQHRVAGRAADCPRAGDHRRFVRSWPDHRRTARRTGTRGPQTNGPAGAAPACR